MTYTFKRNGTILAILLVAALGVLTCEFNRRGATPAQSAAPASSNDPRVADARKFTELYSASRMKRWDIRAAAAGKDCNVLFIRTSLVLEDSLIEAVHFGAGDYDVYNGGVQQFYRDRHFRGVAYQDASNHVWTYGDVSIAEVDTMRPCGGAG